MRWHIHCSYIYAKTHIESNNMTAKKILIVDDEYNTLFAIDFALTNAGYKTTTTEDGSEAINLLKKSLAAKNLFDLVITDMKMPKMTGMELIDEMKKANINVS